MVTNPTLFFWVRQWRKVGQDKISILGGEERLKDNTRTNQ